MTNSTPITAILVAGPETRHLRLPKQTLPFGDSTVLGTTLQAYLDAGVSDVIIVLGYKADAIQAELGSLPPNVRVVKNPLFDEGIVSFLRTGMIELSDSAKAFCIGLQDQPLLTAELIEEFLKAFVDSKKKVLVPACQGSLGLPAFFTANLADELQNLPPNGELWDVLKKHQNDLVDHPTTYTAVLRSIDDLDDYHTLLTIAGLPIPDVPTAIHKDDTPAQEEEEEEASEYDGDPAENADVSSEDGESGETKTPQSEES